MMSAQQPPERRRARNERTYADMRTPLAPHGVPDTQHDWAETWMFLCECVRPDCAVQLQLTSREYAALRGDRAAFVVAPGHREDDDLLVTRTPRFWIIRKVGLEQRLASHDGANARGELEHDLLRSQLAYRDVNDRIERAMSRLVRGDDLIELVCECGQLACSDLVQMLVVDYEHVRADPRSTIVAPGHEPLNAEQVVVGDGYAVVRCHTPGIDPEVRRGA